MGAIWNREEYLSTDRCDKLKCIARRSEHFLRFSFLSTSTIIGLYGARCISELVLFSYGVLF